VTGSAQLADQLLRDHNPLDLVGARAPRAITVR
jgi:hypothetical protein